MAKNLYQRLVDVMSTMGAVGKGGQTNYGEKYRFHRIDDIDDKLRMALVEHKVIAVISDIRERKLECVQELDKHGKPRTTWYAECVLTIDLINADDPSEMLCISGWGQGLDYSDKATGKAISYAAKAAYLSAFHLRGQPDNEQDNISRPAGGKPTAKDNKYITDALGEIAKAKFMDELTMLGEVIKTKSPAIQNALRDAYKARYQQIKEMENAPSDS